MAESMQQKCSHCKKMGMIRCDGCGHRFCSIHFNEHRHHLDTLFERVCNDRDSLCEKINNSSSTISYNDPQIITLLNEINEWESKALAMVQQTADDARQHLKELMNSKSTFDEAELNQLSKELRRRKEDDDYFEQDIERLSSKLEQIQISLDSDPPQIRLNVTPIDWPLVIQVLTEIPKGKTVHQMSNQLFRDGTLLTTDHQIQLNGFYGNVHQKWQLIYKATRNGFNGDIFHQCCDNQSPTLTVVQSAEGYLFGGYTSAHWDRSEREWRVDKAAFLFTLTNPHHIPPTKYRINSNGNRAIWASKSTGLGFGYWDISVDLRKEQHSHSSSEFPKDYIDSTGQGPSTFTGSAKFSLTDVEVYRLASD